MKAIALARHFSSARFSETSGRVAADVVGWGGITGLTTAYLLKKIGCRSPSLTSEPSAAEKQRIQPLISLVTDIRLHELASQIGERQAQALWGAGYLAMNQIEEIARELRTDCELKRVPGYLFAAIGKDTKKERESLQRDAELASQLGFDADFIESDPLFQRPAVRFPNQLKFHPLKYVNALVKTLPGDGCHVFSRTSGSNIDSEKQS
jgi:glycine/D-amino acid oxidase-like deaminating enzyme